MSGAWLDFAIVIFLQFLLFIIHAVCEKKLSDAPRILAQGIFSGIVLGLISDLVLGKVFGLWSYSLGFGALSLILNAVLVYGLFAAHILLMQKSRLLHFCIWTTLVGSVYEVTNHLFRVWTYNLAVSPIEFVIFLLVGYFASALVVAGAWHVFLGCRFLFVDNLLK